MIKMMLRVFIAVAVLTFANGMSQEDDAAIEALEDHANSISNNLMYARAIGHPEITHTVDNGVSTTYLTDVLLAETTCDRNTMSSIHTRDQFKVECPVQNATRPLMVCTGTVIWRDGVPEVLPGETFCGHP